MIIIKNDNVVYITDCISVYSDAIFVNNKILVYLKF